VCVRRTFPVTDHLASGRTRDAPVPADAGPPADGEEGGSKPRKRLVEVNQASPEQKGSVRRRGERQEEETDFPLGGVKPPPGHPTGGFTSLAGGGGR